jgi:PAS domain S-box-containing protein
MFGFSSIDDAMKCDLRTLYRHPGNRDAFLMALGSHGRLEHYRETMKRRDGTLVKVVENVIASFAPNGGLTEIRGYVVDETERALAEEALRASEERYRDLFENAKDVVFTTDLQMRFTSLNLAGETITGYTRAEALRLSVDQVVPAEYLDRIREGLRDQLDGKATQPCEAEVITKDGRRIPMEVSSRVISRLGRPEGIQGIARDISERRRLEEQLRQAQRMEAIGRLAGGIANDFNNLLTVILGHGEELRTCFDPADPRREAALQICNAAERAASLMRKLLAFSRHQTLDPRVLDLNQAVTGLAEKLRRLLGAQVELVIVPAADLHKISVDPAQIEQVIVNLVMNARDAMPRGGRLTIETANAELDARYVLRHRGDRSGSYVRLSISDTGVGMDGETLSRMFEPFFTTKGGGQGSGLGLSTVYGIVKQSGAYISVNSQVGRGSVFDLYFPRVEGGVDADTARTQVARPVSAAKTILIVEEERAVLELASRVLAMSGYTVLAARTAQGARRLSDSHHGPIDLLIIGMLVGGDMNGPALAEVFASEQPDLKVLYMSGRRNGTIVRSGIVQKVVPILSKPFKSDELAAKVRELLEES